MTDATMSTDTLRSLSEEVSSGRVMLLNRGTSLPSTYLPSHRSELLA